MADEPSPRAIWNVRMAINGALLVAYGALLWYGVSTSQISFDEAFRLLGSAALGGGIGWLAK